MTAIDQQIVSVSISGKSYNIKCPPEQAQALQESAQLIEHKLQELKQTAANTTSERMLVVLALNLCHELSLLKNEKLKHNDSIEHKLHQLQARIQNFLSTHVEQEVV